jgi:hypothetical protein
MTKHIFVLKVHPQAPRMWATTYSCTSSGPRVSGQPSVQEPQIRRSQNCRRTGLGCAVQQVDMVFLVYMSQGIPGIRHFRKCLAFLQLPRQLWECDFLTCFKFWEKAQHQEINYKKLNKANPT